MNTKTRALTVEIFHDPDAENPCDEEGAWRPYSFSGRHINYRNPDDFFPDGVPSPEMEAMLEAGTAWVLSYFEHGQSAWMLFDEPKSAFAGDWYWDGVNIAGVLVWEHREDDLGPQTKQDRRADAAAFVETYTQWCNGETYWYKILDSEGEEVGEGGGFIGDDHLIEHLLGELEDGDEITEVRDQVAGLTVESFRR